MENQVEKNMENAFIPAAHAIEEEKQIDIEENTEHMSLAITQCDGETEPNLAAIIAHYAETLKEYNLRNLGYPTNQNFNYKAMAPLLNFHLNNAGDPFIGSSFSLNSRAFEVCMLDWFAKLWEIDKGEYWGYVTSGGTESNFYGILQGREQFPDGILYTSQDSHYSMSKIARIYRLQCVMVGTLVSGKIDCADLKASLLVHKDKPAIINLNIAECYENEWRNLRWTVQPLETIYFPPFYAKSIGLNFKGSVVGTTMKGAVDDLDLVIQTLEESGFTRNRFYIHCDGALSGIMMPFIERAPRISFKKPIGSISVSGHKFLGCPIPCGVIITRLEYINALSNHVEVIASRDTTITGSRCGHAPIFLWYALKQKGLIGLKNEVNKCLMNASYLHNRLRDAGIGAMLNEFSCIVVFERPHNDDFSRRWNLACNGNIALVVVMQHVTIEMLDSFVSEFIQKRSEWFKDGLLQFQPLCIADEVGPKNCVCSTHNPLS